MFRALAGALCALDLQAGALLLLKGREAHHSALQMENAGVGLMALVILAIAVASVALAVASGRMAWRGPPRRPVWALLAATVASLPGLGLAVLLLL